MMREIGLILICKGLGDCLYTIPVLKRLRYLADDKTSYSIFSYHPDIFRNCPYVDRSYGTTSPELQRLKANGATVRLFDPEILPHHRTDTRDFLSIPLNIGSLTFTQKQLEYFPIEEDRSERFDVVLNTSETWPTRTWPFQNWQKLADELVAMGLSVAVVGKDVVSITDKMTKRSYPLNGCTNLVNKLSLDQTYYTIRKSSLFVSCQNGLSVLAGATDTEIVVLGMSIDWSMRAIFRNQDPHYKVTYVEGGCQYHCGQMDSCGMAERGHKEYEGDFKCIPSYEVVWRVVLEKIAASKVRS